MTTRLSISASGMSRRIAAMVLFTILMASLAATSMAATCSAYSDHLHAVGDLPLENPLRMVNEGDALYVLTTDSLHVVDLSVRATPTLLASLDMTGTFTAADLAVDGNLLVFLRSNHLTVLDVQNPTVPMVVGDLPLEYRAHRVDLVAGRAYVFQEINGSPARLTVVDLSDPTTPTVAGHADLPVGAVQAVTVVGNLAYLAADQAGLHLVDVSDPAAPFWLSGTTLSGFAYDVVLHGDHALVAGYTRGLVVVDVSAPETPVEVAAVAADGRAQAVCVTGNTAYVASHDHGGLQTFDVTTVTAPVLLGSLPSHEGYSTDVCAQGTDVYLLDYRYGIRAVDAANPATVSTTAFDPQGDGSAMDIEFVGDLAYVVTYIYASLMIFDMTDPDLPVELGRIALGDEGFAVSIEGDLASVAFLNWGGGAGIRIVDISDPTAPVVVGTYDPAAAVYDVVMSGGKAYVPHGYVVDIVDLSVPSAPALLGSIPAQGGVAVAGDRAYVATAGGLTIWNVAAPAAPVLLGTETSPISAGVVALDGNLAYVSDSVLWDHRLLVIDVSDPAAPTLHGATPLMDHCRDIKRDGDTVYLAAGWQGVQVVDASVPTNPTSIGGVALNQVAQSVAVGAGSLWATDIDLHRLPLECSSVAAAQDGPPPATLPLRAWPNPFNPRSQVSFSLPTAAAVHLTVHDAAGRRVRTLVAGDVLTAGDHSRTWQGRDDGGRTAASGVYFYRLEAGSRRATQRVTLLR